jgi:hypothetical protein
MRALIENPDALSVLCFWVFVENLDAGLNTGLQLKQDKKCLQITTVVLESKLF